METGTATLVDNVQARRFEYFVDGELAAFEDYMLDGDVIAFNHTEALPGAAPGSGTGLVRGILGEAKSRGLQVLPNCGFVAAYIRKHPDEYLSMVPAARRAEYGLPSD